MITSYRDFIAENIDRDSDPEYWGINEYEFNKKTGRLDINQDVYIFSKKIKELPFEFGVVDGDCSFYDNELSNLEGAPTHVKGNFMCGKNKLTSLVGGPTIVEGDYTCPQNHLLNLIGSPKTVPGDYYCFDNLLTSLEGLPSYIGKEFSFFTNRSLDIEKYPYWSTIGNIKMSDYHFNEINDIVNSNREVFIPLMGNKEKFHQQVMRMKPDLIPYYKETSIPVPKKSTFI